MKTIHKYVLEIMDKQELKFKARRDLDVKQCLLHVHEQHGKLCLWAMVDDDAPEKSVTIYIHGTGNPMAQNHPLYLGTAHVGEFVWHVFV